MHMEIYTEYANLSHVPLTDTFVQGQICEHIVAFSQAGFRASEIQKCWIRIYWWLIIVAQIIT